MFSEELGGNASRRRQEEARARRRKLKLQQDQKKAAELEKQKKVIASQPGAATASDKEVVSVPSTASIEPIVGLPSGSAPTPEVTAGLGGTKNAAVANALQQRQARQTLQHQQKAAGTIQSFYRAHRSNVQLLNQQSLLLGQRVQDLSTLTNLLKQQGKTDYVPPPATASALLQQLLFLTQSLRYKSKRSQIVIFRNKVRDTNQLHQVVQLVLLPGMFATDENSNAFLVWLQSKAGRRRIESLLRLLLVTATTSGIEENVQMTCLQFVLAALGISERRVPAQLTSYCKSLLLAKAPRSNADTPMLSSKTQQSSSVRPVCIQDSSLDLISVVRFHLLYCTGGPAPIPKAAENVWDACIPSKDRSQADALFQVIVKLIQKEDQDVGMEWCSRVVSEILTVPLLSWKIRDVSINMLLAASRSTSKPILTYVLEQFVNVHAADLNAGKLEKTLRHDMDLTVCPATPTQCLLANLLQIGKVSPQLNGSQIHKIDYHAASVFFTFVATLVDAVPLATFLSRSSVVEWISDGKGHHSPIVLSSVVMNQCHYLLVDSFVRSLFTCAIDARYLRIDETLNTKTDKDLKQESALQKAGTSAASLAASEARVDRSKRFWHASAWAMKISKGVSTLLDKSSKKIGSDAGGKLINTSTVSKDLAQHGGTDKKQATITEPTVERVGYSPALLMALCKVYGIVLARWGGGGADDIVRGHREESKTTKPEVATRNPDPCTQNLLNTLVFSTTVIRASWALIQSDPQIVAKVYGIIDPTKGKSPVHATSSQPIYGMTGDSQAERNGAALLYVFVCALSHILIVTDDTEIHELEKPLPLHQLRRCIQTLKQLLFRACCLDVESMSSREGIEVSSERKSPTYFGLALIAASSRTMRDLYDRSSRRPLAVPKLWLIDDLMEREIRRCSKAEDYVKLLSTPVLRVCPFLVSFKRRLKLFDHIITTNRVAIQGENSQNPFNTNPLKPGIPIRITRGRILEDGLATMNNLGSNMRQRLSVQYINEAGMQETGIDAGGLFKEFWTDLCAIAFDPNYALFRVTNENCMYPNPSSHAAHGSDHIMLFEFLGRILGKALYEGITVHPQFAHFFLSHLRGDYNYLNMLSDLSTMDSQLYNNIMFLKTYDGDAEDICLTFTVSVDDFGGNKEIPLIPNGAQIEVTNANKQRYIGLVAKYYVVDRIKEQAEAFTRGLREVIDKSWLKIFNEPELQVLISGATDGKIDVEDMRANCRYAGGFTGIDRTVNRFWNVVSAMDRKDQAALLRFITSCERPPPLGFASLNPPLTIQRVGILRDGDKLPSSSTCFNVLKLPTYSSEKVLKDRLLLAINSGAGFELA